MGCNHRPVITRDIAYPYWWMRKCLDCDAHTTRTPIREDAKHQAFPIQSLGEKAKKKLKTACISAFRVVY